MKTILFSMTMAMLVLGGPIARAQDSFMKDFKGSCFDSKPNESVSEAAADAVNSISVDGSIKEAMLKGYELVAVERDTKNPLNCTYRLKKTNESLPAIAAQMKSYEEQYQLLLSEDSKLDFMNQKLNQNVHMFTRNLENRNLFEYKTSPRMSVDTHIHVFVASCDYPRGPVWDALVRETTLNLKLSAIMSVNKTTNNKCLYYFTPDLQKFSP